jgi:hypothetical protein
MNSATRASGGSWARSGFSRNIWRNSSITGRRCSAGIWWRRRLPTMWSRCGKRGVGFGVAAGGGRPVSRGLPSCAPGDVEVSCRGRPEAEARPHGHCGRGANGLSAGPACGAGGAGNAVSIGGGAFAGNDFAAGIAGAMRAGGGWDGFGRARGGGYAAGSGAAVRNYGSHDQRGRAGRAAACSVSVPKRALIAGAQVALDNGDLRIARPQGPLVRELVDVRVTSGTGMGKLRIGADGCGEHDDLVIARALACWRAKRRENGYGVPRLL